MFRQGDQHDALDAVTRLGLPPAVAGVISNLPPYRCLIHVRGQYALVDVKIPKAFTAITDTNTAMRAKPTTPDADTFAEAVA